MTKEKAISLVEEHIGKCQESGMEKSNVDILITLMDYLVKEDCEEVLSNIGEEKTGFGVLVAVFNLKTNREHLESQANLG